MGEMINGEPFHLTQNFWRTLRNIKGTGFSILVGDDISQNPSTLDQPQFCSGKYPVFLWLFKDIMEEVREQLVFQDHLVNAVKDWKNQIIDELKSDRNIIFIGVHCRNDRNL